MGEIAAFLGARLDENQLWADSVLEDWPADFAGDPPPEQAHALFVVADVKAKRQIVDWCMEVIGDRDTSRFGEFGALRDDPQALAVTLAWETLRLLASISDYHMDFDRAWALRD